MNDNSSSSIPGSRYLRWPLGKPLRKFYEFIGNSNILRSVFKKIMPIGKLRSDATDITYISWLVPLERVEKLVPHPLKIQKFCIDNENQFYSVISILSFNNGHFGPSFLGPLRKFFCGSPPQVNCRLYVEPVDSTSPKNDAVFYLSVNMDNPTMTLSGRLFSDGLPVHYVNSIQHTKKNETYTTNMASGSGSGLELFLELNLEHKKELTSKFQMIFSDYDAAAEFIYDRNRAICVKSKNGNNESTTYTVIESLIDPPDENERYSKLIPCSFDNKKFNASDWLYEIVNDCPFISFVIPDICINVSGETARQINMANSALNSETPQSRT